MPEDYFNCGESGFHAKPVCLSKQHIVIGGHL